MSTPIQKIPVRRITGEDTNLGEYSGKVLLVVNVASKCGLTKQYESLEKLYREYRDRGLVVAGFPANDFRGQEPGSNAEIESFCTSNFGVDFPLFEKITVVGEGKHPLYKELIAAQPKATSTSEVHFSEDLKRYGIETNPEPEILWNFEKFVVARTAKSLPAFLPIRRPTIRRFCRPSKPSWRSRVYRLGFVLGCLCQSSPCKRNQVDGKWQAISPVSQY